LGRRRSLETADIEVRAPEVDLAVVFIAGNYGQGGIWSKFKDQIVPNDIIAAIQT
jgi:hypothetical protein